MAKKLGFTMAEILLSLTIIGVVAAITLPSLMANINERTWNTQRKALYARLSQAIAMMPQLNGYGEYEGTNTDGSVTATKDTEAEAFLTEGLSKVLKINNICDAEHLSDCGIAASYTDIAGSIKLLPVKLSGLNSLFTSTYSDSTGIYANPLNFVDTKVAAFETMNGESVVSFYNPYCTADLGEGAGYYSQTKMCVNFIYDLNGNKGPNSIGKDMGFMTALYASEPVFVAPVALPTDASNSIVFSAASAACTAQDSESRLPNKEELASLFYNRELINMSLNPAASGTLVSSGDVGVWNISFDTGRHFIAPKNSFLGVRCIKR